MLRKWFERKFLTGILGAVAAFVAAKTGVPALDILAFVAPLVAWILGEAHVDGIKTKMNPPKGPNPDDVDVGYYDPKTPKSKATPPTVQP